MHYFHLKNSVKIEQKNCKNTKNCQYLEDGWEHRKILKISVFDATFECSTKNDYCFWIVSIKQMFKIERYIKVVKNKFRQQVWGLDFFPPRYLAFLKISRKSGTVSCSISLVSYIRGKPPKINKRFSFREVIKTFSDSSLKIYFSLINPAEGIGVDSGTLKAIRVFDQLSGSIKCNHKTVILSDHLLSHQVSICTINRWRCVNYGFSAVQTKNDDKPSISKIIKRKVAFENFKRNRIPFARKGKKSLRLRKHVLMR